MEMFSQTFVATGKTHLPMEQRKEHEEKVLCEEMRQRARSGEHFPSYWESH